VLTSETLTVKTSHKPAGNRRPSPRQLLATADDIAYFVPACAAGVPCQSIFQHNKSVYH